MRWTLSASIQMGRRRLGETLAAHRNVIMLSYWKISWCTEYMCNLIHKCLIPVLLNQVNDVGVCDYWSSPKLWDYKHSQQQLSLSSCCWMMDFLFPITCFGNTVVSFCVIHSKFIFLIGTGRLWKKVINHLNSFMPANYRCLVRISYRLSAQAIYYSFICYKLES